MGIDFNQIFGNVQDAAAKAFEDVKATGVPALEASVENWAADNLKKMAAQNQGTVNTNVKEILNRPSDPGGLGSYISNTMKQPLVQQYGGFALIGVAVLVGAFVFMKRG